MNDASRRNNTIKVRVTDEELRAARALAEQTGESVANVLRRMLHMHGDVAPVAPAVTRGDGRSTTKRAS